MRIWFDASGGSTPTQTLYVVVYPAALSPPSNAQIVAGHDYTDSSAAWAGNAAYTGTGQYLDASGLDAGTSYKASAVIYDGTEYSNVVTSSAWDTTSASVNLTLNDASHAHSADTPTLSTTGSDSLAVNDASHAHGVDSPALTAQSYLSVNDSAHAHLADQVTLLAGLTLAINDAAHSHNADTPALEYTEQIVLAVLDAVHAHASDEPSLTSQSALAILDALHAHAADAPTLTIPAEPGTGTLDPATIAAIADAVWDTELETGYTAREMMRIMFASLAGKRDGLGTATEYYYDVATGLVPRVIFTPDINGNGVPVVDGS